MSYFTSVAEIDRMLADLPPVDGATQNKVAARQSQLTKPPGSLGKLEDIAIWMAGWQRTEQHAINAS
ncbi:MAG: nicotinate-nucleotide--dimethylbenzimidazole phosphoribosyltransferase [Alphaproteobacteria bacterium]